MSLLPRSVGDPSAASLATDQDLERGASFGLATLCELFENDHAAIVGLLEAALASIERDVLTIEGAALTIDGRRVMVEGAHRIKGTSGSIGATGLVEISSRIESTISLTGDAARCEVLAGLRAAVSDLRTDIAAYVRR